MFLIFFVIIPFCLLVSEDAFAHHGAVGGFGVGRAGPITTVPAVPLVTGRFSVGTRMEYTKFSRFTDSQLKNFALEGKEVDSTNALFTPFLGAAYGVTDNLMVMARFPYVSHDDIREGHREEDGGVEVHREGDSADFGDLTLLGLYRFLKGLDKDYHIAGILGLKTPTGRTTERALNGRRFEVEHQPGSGSWDPMAGLAFTKHWGHLSLDTNVLYTFTTQGSQRTILGDIFNYNLGLSYRLTKERHVHWNQEHGVHWHVDWDLAVELNGEWRQKQEIKERKDDNSGGNLVYFSPGVRATINDRVFIPIAIGIPIIEDTNGLEHEVDYRLVFGVGIGF
ncbi:MAG TPA: transporter [Candidatus Hypogeohydataceae bacterium YC38]|nr:transporter [Candidatus Brocadiales bacterium]